MVALVLALSCPFGPVYASSSQELARSGEDEISVALSVMTYNIHVGIGTDGVLNLGRIAAIISESKAVIVGLQEVDQNTARSGGVDQARELGKLTGMQAVFGPAYAYRGGFFGPAVLTSLPIVDREVIPLPHKAENEPRVVVMVRVLWQGREITIFNTHLEHQDAADRAAQGAALSRIVGEYAAQGPTILMGDLNAQPMELSVLGGLHAHMRDAYGLALARAMQQGEDAVRRLGDGNTFDSSNPRRRIDYVWVSEHFELADVPEPLQVIQSNASDHLPMVVHLKLVK